MHNLRHRKCQFRIIVCKREVSQDDMNCHGFSGQFTKGVTCHWKLGEVKIKFSFQSAYMSAQLESNCESALKLNLDLWNTQKTNRR